MSRPLDFYDIEPVVIDDSSIEDVYLQEQENRYDWFNQEVNEIQSSYKEVESWL